MRRPTMRDVANSADVSLKTVSRVVNREPGVRPEMAARVEAAIDRLGFRRNEIAWSLRNGRAGAVGLVIEDLSNPFYSAIAGAVEQEAHDRGHALLIGSCEEDPVRERALVTRLLHRWVDALLIVPAGADHRYLLAEQHEGTPLVFIDRPAGGLDADTVLLDNVGGARRAVAHLLAHGHRRIGFVGESRQLYTAARRLDGYQEALAAAGIAFTEDLVAMTAGDPEGGTRALLDLPPDQRPTALFCANNRTTIGALRAVRGAPVALVGFDDFELAELLAVPVTVVRFDAAALGRSAARRAYARIDGDRALPTREIVPCELVPRGSGEVPPA